MPLLIALVICVILYLIGLRSLAIFGFLIFCIVWGYSNTDTESSSKHSSSRKSGSNRGQSKPPALYDKVYEDGTHRIENLSGTGYYYSDRKESWVGILGEEHRSNGEVVRENAYIPGRRDVYNSKGEYIGYEYEDSMGITRRVHHK